MSEVYLNDDYPRETIELDDEGNPQVWIDYGVVEVVKWENVEVIAEEDGVEQVAFTIEGDPNTIRTANILRSKE